MSLSAEVRKSASRLRTWVMLGLVALLPTIFAFGTRYGDRGDRGRPDAGDAPFFLVETLRNGAGVPFVALVILSSFLLPLVVAVHSGDALGGEAAGGTLRYLLVRPVRRARLYGVKLASVTLFAAVATVVTLLVGLLWGAALFPTFRPLAIGSAGAPRLVPLGAWAYSGRAAVAGGYVVVALVALGSIGLLVGMLTASPGAANGVVIGALIAMQIVNQIDALRRVHPLLLTHWLMEWTNVLQAPVRWQPMLKGVVCFVAYIAGLTSVGLWSFQKRDVLS